MTRVEEDNEPEMQLVQKKLKNVRQLGNLMAQNYGLDVDLRKKILAY
jgi:hypothetical protein